jgi:hypothetical protein
VSEPSIWPTTVEGWSTLTANSIAIATFIFGRRAFLGYLVSIRRALEALRFAAPSGAAPPDVRLPHVNIEIERPAPDNRWHVKWTPPDAPIGLDGMTKLTPGVAAITSLRLRWHLHWHKDVRNLTIFGEVRFLATTEGARLVEIPAVDYITRGGIPGWLARILFG